MILFLKRHKVSIVLLIISSIIGLIALIKEKPVDIWRIEYEFNAAGESHTPKFCQADTVFEFNGIICRNYTSSIADTLIDGGVRRQELKIHVPRPSEQTALEIGNDLFKAENISILSNRFQETQRDKRGLLNWILFGFFLGMIVEFVIALKKKPSTK